MKEYSEVLCGSFSGNHKILGHPSVLTVGIPVSLAVPVPGKFAYSGAP
jgi:hypothetical protein